MQNQTLPDTIFALCHLMSYYIYPFSDLLDFNLSLQKLLDARTKRKQRKVDMAKRRTLASQQRMKIITQLAGGKVCWTADLCTYMNK